MAREETEADTSDTLQEDIKLNGMKKSNAEEVWHDFALQKLKQNAQKIRSSLVEQIDSQLACMVDDFMAGEMKPQTQTDGTSSTETPSKKRNSGDLPDKEFVVRESLLTELLEINHIQTIYNIFVSILMLLFLNTVLYDIVETGTSRLERLEKWMHSEKGRTVVSYLLSGITVTAFTACILPHSYCIDRLKRVLQAYKDGIPETLNPVVQIRAEQVLKECKILERERRLINFFPICGFNIAHCGSATLVNGALVGIPINFKYQNVEDIERPSIRVHNNSEVSWSSDAGQNLQESLILSEDAQKFAIAREVYACCNYYIFYNASILGVCILFASTLPRHVNDRMNLFQRPRSLRVILYMLSSALGAAFYVTLKDMINVYWDKRTDDLAAKMGPRYLQGGIEFYEKQLQRNRALRTLMGDFGARSFTIHGNDKTWLRTPHLTPTARLDFLKKYLIQEASDEEMLQ